jgi:hypothetical protein
VNDLGRAGKVGVNGFERMGKVGVNGFGCAGKTSVDKLDSFCEDEVIGLEFLSEIIFNIFFFFFIFLE